MSYYFGVFKFRAKALFQYRLALFSSTPLYFMNGLLSLSILFAFQQSSGDAQVSFQSLVNYVWIQTSFAPFASAWVVDNELNNLIKTGDVAYEYIKPIDIYWSWFSRLTSQRVVNSLFSSLPVLIAAVLLPAPFSLTVMGDKGLLAAFAISIFLALILNTVLSLLVYISVFHTYSITGSLLVFGSIMQFAGGLVIPYTLFPKALTNVLDVFPFRYGAAFPFQLLSQTFQIQEILTGIAMQLLWIVVVVFLGKAWLNKIITKLVIQGG